MSAVWQGGTEVAGGKMGGPGGKGGAELKSDAEERRSG